MQDVTILQRCVAWSLALMATAALSVVVTVAAPASTAEAVDNCGKIIPTDVYANWSTFFYGGNGALVLSPQIGTLPPVGPGIAVPSAATGATALTVGAGAAAVATAVTALFETCAALDWITGDGSGWGCSWGFCDPVYQYTPVAGESQIEMSGKYDCAALRTGYDQYRCLQATFPAQVPFPNGTYLRTPAWGGFTVGNNVFNPPSAAPGLFVAVTGSSSINENWWSPNLAMTSSTCSHTTSGSNCRDWATYAGNAINLLEYCLNVTAASYPPLSSTNTVGTVSDVGGNCGRHPQQTVVATNGTTVHAVWNPTPVVREKGWIRRTVTDVLCSTVTSSPVTTWVRATSPQYYDYFPTQRVPVPDCQPGETAVRILQFRMPKGVTCILGQACMGPGSVIMDTVAPVDWAKPGSVNFPNASGCLQVGGNCGDPETVNSVCTWGGAAVPASYCDPTRQTNRTDPTTSPRETTTFDAGAAPTYDPASTTPRIVNTVDYPEPNTETTPPGGGTGTTNIDVEGGVRAAGGGSGGCDLLAFSWNPTDWILRPIKCAADWAFVPSSTALDARLTEFEAFTAEPPLQWAAEGVSYVSSVSFGFDTWADAGPACFSIMDNQVCPRTWDQNSLAPTWLVALMGLGLWLVVIVGVWRFF